MAANKPYLIDAVIGNGRMLGTLDSRGELHRLWWPRPDFAQHVDRFWTGIRFHGTEKTSWLHGAEWKHEQQYAGDTAILKTVAERGESGVRVSCEDVVVPGRSVLLRRYVFHNSGKTPQSAVFVVYTSFRMGEMKRYNTTFFECEEEALVHYRNEFAVAVGADRETSGYQAGRGGKAACSGEPDGTRIDMCPEGVMTWDLGMVEPGGTREINLFVAFGESPEAALAELKRAKEAGGEALLRETESWWADWLAGARRVETGDETVDRLYRRSLIVFRLMTDELHGSMIAAPEFDEDFARCGGYAYCWGRDAAYIATAIDRAGYHDMVQDFYRWTVKVQSPDGSWEQRHYLDGRPAPRWGLQIDETGSILWGMWQHYLLTRDQEFLIEIWQAAEKGARFLTGFIDPETGLPMPSRDLWEERDGEHTYSAAAVYGGLRGAAEIAERLGHADRAEQWRSVATSIREAVLRQLWNEERQAFYRGLKRAVDAETAKRAEADGHKVVREKDAKGYVTHRLWFDPVIDASLLGVSMPFELLPADDERFIRTVDAVESCLTSPVGGIKRYENDDYIGGNPWVLTTLWLAMVRIRQSRPEDALKLLRWAVSHRTSLDLLPEQIDRRTGEPAWVVPLTWSHAMFVLTVLDLVEAGVLAEDREA
jgi:glucoamylase